jgi:hypothetical protein
MITLLASYNLFFCPSDDRQRFGCAKVLLCQTGNQKPYIDEKQEMFADVKVIIRSRKSEDRQLLFDDAKVVIVVLQFTASDYILAISKLFLSFDLRLLITTLASSNNNCLSSDLRLLIITLTSANIRDNQ